MTRPSHGFAGFGALRRTPSGGARPARGAFGPGAPRGGPGAGPRFGLVPIPAVFFWILLALAAALLISAARALPRALRAAPGARTDPWLTFADHVLSIPPAVALALGEMEAAFYATLVLGPVLTWSLVRSFRSASTSPSTSASKEA